MRQRASVLAQWRRALNWIHRYHVKQWVSMRDTWDPYSSLGTKCRPFLAPSDTGLTGFGQTCIFRSARSCRVADQSGRCPSHVSDLF
eukprot:g66790.t1